jgi:hypothetical protein
VLHESRTWAWLKATRRCSEDFARRTRAGFQLCGGFKHAERLFSGRLYCTERALWKLNWFLRDFGYDSDLLHQDQIDERALLKLRGVVRTSHVTLNGRSFQNLEAFAPAPEWEELSCESVGGKRGKGSGDDL